MSATKPDPAEMDFSGVTWEKSPFSGGNDNCMEFGVKGDLIAVRDSKRPEQTPLVYTRSEIKAMISGAKAGAFDHLV
ncbi:DUF397 domain-containing protein [Streptomyces sp. H10-C2]|uniref:DUF397 domain-containing protein n=1 Tax=unclassified Streptomyces TaxID=2593676 RepID=UPI0024B99557|nr:MULTISPECIES: DUF397 domain-containing protein [unclassified Streptomyces]MDJ0340425.1 DUF397 domain-containing protein [Streptomyces sp. PH10-H1]MDJ0368127.1 DUF397 domain-containing protein [Streptomyces sp. H10-C2]